MSETQSRSSERHEEFREELRALINRNSMDAECGTPDYILADYLYHCMGLFRHAVKDRSKWFGEKSEVFNQPRLDFGEDYIPNPKECSL